MGRERHDREWWADTTARLFTRQRGRCPVCPTAVEAEQIRSDVLGLLARLAAHPLGPPAHEVLRRAKWDLWARGMDARIARCEKGCGAWTMDYPVCRTCRTRHQRRRAA